MTKVVHCKKEPYDVYIGRGSKWGNPFIIGKDGNRDEVIKKYHMWIIKQPELMNSLNELDSKTLGCWCVNKPINYVRKNKRCHGEVLLKLLDNKRKNNELKIRSGFFRR